MGDARPAWPYSLTEAEFKLMSHHIVMVRHRWEYTSADSTREWLEFSYEKHVNFTTELVTFIAPQNWSELFEFKPYHAGIIQPNYTGRLARERMQEIAAWEDKNAEDRAEYERLKAKFDGPVA